MIEPLFFQTFRLFSYLISLCHFDFFFHFLVFIHVFIFSVLHSFFLLIHQFTSPKPILGVFTPSHNSTANFFLQNSKIIMYVSFSNIFFTFNSLIIFKISVDILIITIFTIHTTTITSNSSMQTLPTLSFLPSSVPPPVYAYSSSSPPLKLFLSSSSHIIHHHQLRQ